MESSTANQYAELLQRYTELSRRVEELAIFREIALAVNSILDLHNVLETVVSKVTALFDAPIGVIYLLDPSSEKLVPKVARYGNELRREDDVPKELVAVGEGPVGKALGERLGTIVESPDGYCSLVEPLIAKHEGIGVIEVSRRNTQGRFEQKDSNLLSVVSSQVAVAIHNALLYSLSTTDSLTKLYVRRYFNLRLKEEFFAARRYEQPLSILMIDIDHFKKFNDSYGHQTGDLVLKGIAEIIIQNCRRSDVACRYGGEELAVILVATGLKGARTVGEKMRQRVGQTVFSFGKGAGQAGKRPEESTKEQPKKERAKRRQKTKKPKVTVSIGVASYQTSMRTPEELVARADAALYKAKAKGRNAVVVAEPAP